MVKKILNIVIVQLMFCTLSLTAQGGENSVTSSVGDTLSVATNYKQARQNAKNFERNVASIPFIEKGETVVGISASYGTLSASNAEMLLVLEGIEASGKIVSVKPYVGYAYKPNNVAGVRFSYLDISGTLENSELNLGSNNDVELEMPYIDVASSGYSAALFHRSYAGLDKKGRIGLFAELELGSSWGETRYKFDMEGTSLVSHSKNRGYFLNFNPGASVYIFPNVSTTLSLGLGGINYNHIEQFDENGVKIGERESSKFSFKFNILAINLGFVFHIW